MAHMTNNCYFPAYYVYHACARSFEIKMFGHGKEQLTYEVTLVIIKKELLEKYCRFAIGSGTSSSSCPTGDLHPSGPRSAAAFSSSRRWWLFGVVVAVFVGESPRFRPLGERQLTNCLCHVGVFSWSVPI